MGQGHPRHGYRGGLAAISGLRFSALGPRSRIVLGIVLVITIVVALFDWNWLRRPLERYLIHRSDRQVTIGDLHVKLGFTLEPTVRLRGVYVENAPWAAKRPVLVAGEISFTGSLRSLWEGRPVISRLVLVDAEVDLERQADGLRNWRLVNPDNRGPGKVRVLALEAHRSQLRFVNRAIDLDLLAAASDPEKDKRTRENEGLASRIVFKGTYQGASFAGETLAGAVLTFRQTGRSFPVRGHMTSGKTRLEVEGLLTDVFDLGPIDVKVRLAGPTLSQLHPFVRIRPPASRPYALEARLVQADNKYEFSQLKARIGGTDISGNAIFDRRPERPMVHAALRSEAADLADLAPRVAEPNAPKDEAFRVAALKNFDARVTLHAVKLKAPDVPMLESLRLAAELTKGVLELKPIDLRIAGGHVSGSVTFNAGGQAPSVRAAIDLRNIQLEKLVPSLSTKARSTGAIHGQITFAGGGNSIAAILGSATGSLTARMDGGSISNLADAKLGLNAGKILSLMLRGDQDIPINCGAAAFVFRSGVGKSETIVLDTAQTHVDGTGTIDLRNRGLDLLLTPQPKKPGFFTRPASVRIHGPFGNVETSLQERVALGRGGKAVPAGALRENGGAPKEPCGAVR